MRQDAVSQPSQRDLGQVVVPARLAFGLEAPGWRREELGVAQVPGAILRDAQLQPQFPYHTQILVSWGGHSRAWWLVLQFGLERGPVDAPLELGPPILREVGGRLEDLAAGEGLDEHPPGLERPHCRHEVHACEEANLRLCEAAAAKDGAHAPLGGGEEGLGVLEPPRLPERRGRARSGVVAAPEGAQSEDYKLGGLESATAQLDVRVGARGLAGYRDARPSVPSRAVVQHALYVVLDLRDFEHGVVDVEVL